MRNPITLELVRELPPSRRVLDVATGVGTLLPYLRERLGAETVVGVDLTREMVALADGSFGRVAGDAAVLPLRDESFDLAVLAFVLFHLEAPGRALDEARRVLAPGGTIGIVTWQSDTGTAAGRAWDDELDRFGAAPGGSISNHDLVNSPEKVTSLLTSAGFVDIRAWTLHRTEQIDFDRFIDRQTSFSPMRRLASLEPDARDACLKAATERVGKMPEDAFRAEWEFVLAVGRA